MLVLATDVLLCSVIIPFSDLKPCANKYILELWQAEWDITKYNNKMCIALI